MFDPHNGRKEKASGMEAFQNNRSVRLTANRFETVFRIKNLALLVYERKIKGSAVHMRNQSVQRVDSSFQSGFG